MSEKSKIFLSGVVEGFYGRPWTMNQRKELFRREQKWGLNTYLYAPKDDYKHRMYWRDLYSLEEADQLITLISAAKECNVEFIYAISPGLDITFSNPKEVSALKRKLSQVSEFGCRSFALLFDDIETEMCPADKEAFGSFADAQVSVTNEVFQHLKEPQVFLFCPTDYCAAFCTPSVQLSKYLNTVGEKLNPGIDVLWTDGEDQGSDYIPHDALRLALTEWLVEFGKADQPDGSRSRSGRSKREASEEEPMQTDGYVPGPKDNPLYTAEPLTLEDLNLLSELFYLPYEHGPTAVTMLKELHWLRDNSDAATTGDITTECERVKEWRQRAVRFDEMCAAVVQMFNRLSNVPNRLILYDLYNYICDIKSGVLLARAFVKTLGGGTPHPAMIINDNPEPWGFRGGLSGEFQRMLPCHGNRDLFRIPPATRMYTIRPNTAEDQPEVMKLFKEMNTETQQTVELIGDRLVQGDVHPTQNCSLILEDSSGICGYVFALSDAKTAMTKAQYPEAMLSDYPSVMTVQIHPKVPDPTATKRLIEQVLSSLRESGSKGVYIEFRSNDRRMMDFLKTLNFFQVLRFEGLPANLVVMGTKL
ncbi:protein O-GlcNAcase isoform X2 [Misgurnus anguillicaudatus]|uniref:protein O-GlcNAcase isoform X2 n=1 Tax=Misgurnus anguillicaudatus TaxID=75329 RepID=UPI003CCFD49D